LPVSQVTLLSVMSRFAIHAHPPATVPLKSLGFRV
jgi:hypothetical protein